jgi:hypothetical protein
MATVEKPRPPGRALSGPAASSYSLVRRQHARTEADAPLLSLRGAPRRPPVCAPLPAQASSWEHSAELTGGQLQALEVINACCTHRPLPKQARRPLPGLLHLCAGCRLALAGFDGAAPTMQSCTAPRHAAPTNRLPPCPPPPRPPPPPPPPAAASRAGHAFLGRPGVLVGAHARHARRAAPGGWLRRGVV